MENLLYGIAPYGRTLLVLKWNVHTFCFLFNRNMTVYLGLDRKLIIWNKKFSPDHRDVWRHLHAQSSSACWHAFVIVAVIAVAVAVVVVLFVIVRPFSLYSYQFFQAKLKNLRRSVNETLIFRTIFIYDIPCTKWVLGVHNLPIHVSFVVSVWGQLCWTLLPLQYAVQLYWQQIGDLLANILVLCLFI